MKNFFIALTLLIFPLTTQAASGLIINLSYSDSRLSFGSPELQKNDSVNISPMEFDNKSKASTGPFTLLITDWNNRELVLQKFNAQAGKFSLKVPYYPTVKRMEISETINKKLILEKDLSDISTCNTNDVCEFEKGETASTCIPDCGISHPKYSKETEKILKANSGTIVDSQGKTLLKKDIKASAISWAIGTIIIISAIIALIIFLRRRKYGN